MFYRIFRRVRRRAVRRKPRKASNRKDYLARKEAARVLAAERLAHFAAQYAALPAPLGPELAVAMQYKRLAIRNTRSRWGSCSSRKNLNFNYRILDLPPEHRDYVITHELCHLKELHHGKRFWDLMEIIMPDAKKLSTLLRNSPLTRAQ